MNNNESNGNKKSKKSGRGKKFRKFIPLTGVTLMALILGIIIKRSGEPLSVKTILKYTPDNPVLAAIILVLFFSLKSLTVVVPLSILYLSSGILFSPLFAVLISTIGLVMTITIPYWIGRFSGEEITRNICLKYPKAQKMEGYQNENAFFVCFITRIIGFLPCDIVSLYFGACNTNFIVYLLAGVSGSLLSIITNTLLGTRLSNPFSIEFIVVLLCRIMISAGSIILKYCMDKRTAEK